MKTSILSLIYLAITIPSVAFSDICPVGLTEKNVLAAALAIEKLNQAENPLTTEVFSYSSLENTWAVFFSHSGKQNIWKVITSPDGCQILAVYK